jgi:hypothetical protein
MLDIIHLIAYIPSYPYQAPIYHTYIHKENYLSRFPITSLHTPHNVAKAL